MIVGRIEGRAWITEFVGGDGPAVRPVRPVRPSGRLRWADGRLPVAGYRAAVAAAVARMRSGELDKAALAHDLLAVAEAPLDPRFLLGGLARRYPSCWSFAVEGLVGATPELLMRRSGATVSSRVLAGTAWSEAVLSESGAPADRAELAAVAAVVGEGPPRARARRRVARGGLAVRRAPSWTCPARPG